MSLTFTFTYTSGIADRRFERAPQLRVWRNFGPKRNLGALPVAWHENSQTLSRPLSVTVPLDDYEGAGERAKAADAVHFEVFAQTQNKDGSQMRQRVGYGALRIGELLAWQSASNKKPLAVMLALYNYWDGDGKRVPKGQLNVESVTFDDEWRPHRDEEDPFEFVPSNEQFISSTSRNAVARSIIPYTDQAAAAGLGIDPIAEPLKRVHAPFYNTTAGMTYGPYYWLTPGRDSSNNQAYFDQLLGYALRRDNRTAEWFVSTIERQFAQPANDPAAYDDEFTECARLIGIAVAIPATSLPYVGDSVDLNDRFKTSQNGYIEHRDDKIHATESWDCAICRNGGDCEDLAHLIHRTYRGLRQGEWADGSLAAAARRVLRLYTGCGSLGSVLSAALGNDMTDPAAAKRDYIIGTQRDNNVKVGAHMWYELMPTAKFVALLRRTTDDVPDDLELETPAWRVHLPHMIEEGTGRLDPLQRPRISYLVHASKIDKLDVVARAEAHQRVLKHLMANTRTTKLMQMVRAQAKRTRVPNARVNHFYRRTTAMTTVDFLERGYSVLEFMWTTVGARQPVPQDADPHYEDDPLSASALAAAGEFAQMERALDMQPVQATADSSDADADTVSAKGAFSRIAELFGAAVAGEVDDHHLRTAGHTQRLDQSKRLRYGIDMADKLEDRPLLAHAGLMPTTLIDAVEARVAAETFKNMRPIALPGDDEIALQMMAAEDESLRNIGRDPQPERDFADAQLGALVRWAGATFGAAWPTHEEARARYLSLVTLFVSKDHLRPLPGAADGQKTAFRRAIEADFAAQKEAGVIVYGRVYSETSLPQRTDVVLQFYCDHGKIGGQQ